MNLRCSALVVACSLAVAQAGTKPEGVEFLARNAQKEDVVVNEKSGLQRVAASLGLVFATRVAFDAFVTGVVGG